MGHYPRLNHIFITERLKYRLNQISNHPLTTVIAPMGFGKTTAISWWARRAVKNQSHVIILRQMIEPNADRQCHQSPSSSYLS